MIPSNPYPNMKKYVLAIIMVTLSTSVFGQQNLWTTFKPANDSIKTKVISMSDVPNEVLKIYDQYDYYFDLTGYTKKRFIKEMDMGFNDWAWLNDINELTVFALKSNTGNGSYVLVLCVSKDYANMLIFSNNITQSNNPQGTNSYEREKFKNWVETLLN